MDKIIAVAGPTAVGKTKFAIEIARAFNGEIVSCDSMQIYKYMDIGSAKPSPEERAAVPHYLVDTVDPRESFSVARYQKMARSAIESILARGRLPVVSGGTGLYLNAILYPMDFSDSPGDSAYRQRLEEICQKEGKESLHKMLRELDPEAAEGIHVNNTRKIIRALERINQGEKKIRAFRAVEKMDTCYDAVLIGLTRRRDELYDRINRRVDDLMDMGLLQEVEGLRLMGLTKEDIAMKGIGYKEIMEFLEGSCSLDEALENIKKNTRHYAKKQLTWFRRYDRIKWYNISDFDNDDRAIEEIKSWLEKKI